MKALLGRAGDDEPQPKKRSSGETEKGFGIGANVVTRHSANMVRDVYAAASGYLFATLDWLNPYHNDHDNFVDMDNDPDNSNANLSTLDF